MNQIIAFEAPGDPAPLVVPVSAQNPLPVVFVTAPVGAAGLPSVRSQLISFIGADGQPLQVAVSEANPLPITIS